MSPKVETLVATDVSLNRALNVVLEKYIWPKTLETQTAYTRVQDDCDGDPSQALSVYITPDGDVHIPLGLTQSLRFRTQAGGGMSPRVRNALLVLAEAIRRDNEALPQYFSSTES